VPQSPNIQNLLDAAVANPDRAVEYARQILAISQREKPIADRSQMRDKRADIDHPPGLVPVVQPELAPSRWIVLTGIPALAPSGPPWTAGRIQFQFSPGFLIGMRGSVVRDVTDNNGAVIDWAQIGADAFACEMQLAFNGGEPIITSGDAAAWLKFCDVFGVDHGVAPILRRMEQSDTLNVSMRNVYPAAFATLIPSIHPTLTFLYLADRDLPELLAATAAR